MDGLLAGKSRDFGIKAFTGCDVNDMIGKLIDRIFASSGDQDHGNFSLVESAAFLDDPGGRTGVGYHNGTILRGGKKE